MTIKTALRMILGIKELGSLGFGGVLALEFTLLLVFIIIKSLLRVLSFWITYNFSHFSWFIIFA